MTLMAEYQAKDLTVDRIYDGVYLRQLNLVSSSFDICMQVAGLANTKKSSDFYTNEDVGITDRLALKRRLKMLRGQMIHYLHDNSKDIYIADGGTKSRKKFTAKAREKKPTDIKDGNRLSVISEKPQLLDHFIDGLSSGEGSEWRIDTAPEWTLKEAGFVVRMFHVFDHDGFPHEIQQRDPRQQWLSSVMTHHLHHIYRMPIKDSGEKFTRYYNNVPEIVSQSIDNADTARIPAEDISLVKQFKNDLSVLIEQTKDCSIENKRRYLMQFQQDAHEAFYQNAAKEWQDIYSQAKALLPT